jgi:hypothetical protein
VSTLRVDAIQNRTGGDLITAKGMARAWVNFDGTGTVAIRDSFNVSSITDNGVGNYTLNFTTAMPSASYSVAGVVQFDTTNGRSPRVFHPMLYNTGSLRINTVSTSSSEDLPYINVVIFD